jgi:hypothetical protein
MNEDNDEFAVSVNAFSECCGAPIYGEIIDELGICSRCKEWSGVVREEDENNE